MSSGPASVLPGALVSELGSPDATISVVPAAKIPAVVLVDMGRGAPSAGAEMVPAILRSLAVVRARDGGEILIRDGRGAGVFQLPSAWAATSAAHDELVRMLVQALGLYEPEFTSTRAFSVFIYTGRCMCPSLY